MTLPQHDAYDIRITEISVMSTGQPLFSEQTTHIRIDDEAAGEYVKVMQEGGHTSEEKWVLIDPKEWPAIRDAIEFMTQEYRTETADVGPHYDTMVELFLKPLGLQGWELVHISEWPISDSVKRLKAYLKRPLRTDWRP